MSNNLKLALVTGLLLFSGLGLIVYGILNKPQPLPPSTATPTVVPTPTSFKIKGISDEEIYVSRAIDGDTIELEDGRKVRYIGVDTPETVDPRRAVACFGKEASSENKNLVEGKKVILVKDVSEIDRFDRLLRYVYLPLEDGRLLFVNDYLVREGYAKLVTFPPDVKFTEQFQEAEQEARENKKGLWGKC